MRSWEKWEADWSLDKIRDIWKRQMPQHLEDPVRNYVAEHAGDSFLDVGCGGGLAYDVYKKHKPSGKYLGVDITPKMVTTAKELFPEGKFIVHDATDLKNIEEKYDTVQIRHLIEHHPPETASEIINAAIKASNKEVVIVLFIPPKKKGEPEVCTDGGFYANKYSLEWFEKWDEYLMDYKDFPDSNECVIVIKTSKKMVVENMEKENTIDESYDALADKCDGFDEGGLIFTPTAPKAEVRTTYEDGGLPCDNAVKKIEIHNQDGGVVNIYSM